MLQNRNPENPSEPECPVCPSCYPEMTFVNLMVSILKCALSYAIISFPAYKTYKAIESRKLIAAQGMLAYWAVLCIVNATKDSFDEIFGKYANFMLWKTLVGAVKLAPLVIGPEALYCTLIRPFFATNEETIDTALAQAQSKKEELQPKIEQIVHQQTEQIRSVFEESVDKVKEVLSPIGITKKNDVNDQNASLTQKHVENNADDLNGTIYDSADAIHQRRVKLQSAETASS